MLAFIFYIGITVGSNSDKSNQIADAIQENTELKLKVNELNDQIAQNAGRNRFTSRRT